MLAGYTKPRLEGDLGIEPRLLASEARGLPVTPIPNKRADYECGTFTHQSPRLTRPVRQPNLEESIGFEPMDRRSQSLS